MLKAPDPTPKCYLHLHRPRVVGGHRDRQIVRGDTGASGRSPNYLDRPTRVVDQVDAKRALCASIALTNFAHFRSGRQRFAT